MSPLEDSLTTEAVDSPQKNPYSDGTLEEAADESTQQTVAAANDGAALTEASAAEVEDDDDDDSREEPSRWWHSLRESVQQKFASNNAGSSSSTDAAAWSTARKKGGDIADYQALQPGKISITVVMDIAEGSDACNELLWIQTKLGLTFADAQILEAEALTQNPKDSVTDAAETNTPSPTDEEGASAPESTDEGDQMIPVVIIDTVDSDSPIASILKPLQERQNQDTVPHLIVTTVNDNVCQNLGDLVAAITHAETGQAITVKCRVDGGYDKLVQAVVLKPAPDTQLGIGLVHSKHAGGQMLLTVDKIVPLSCLEYSTLGNGDLILAIDGQPCHDMDPEGAAYFLRSADHCVSILALKPGPAVGRAQRWLRQAKRAGVAVGGGAMVGVGLVFIPTLPPPFGEVLIAGGVSFLATEFEGPRRVVRSCRDSVERWVGREEAEHNDSEADESSLETTEVAPVTGSASHDDSGSAENASECQEASETQRSVGDLAQKKTVKDRLRNFGRRHVLPFLDQVVGEDSTGSKDEADSSKPPSGGGLSKDEEDRKS